MPAALGGKVILAVEWFKSWENARLVCIKKVQEIEKLLHALEKREVSCSG
jgi:hypothetical protein